MTDREKLVEMINHVSEGHVGNLMQPGGVEELADCLIAHGVTVKQMQKPLAYSKVFHSQYLEPQWWVELENGDIFCSRDDEAMFSLDSYDKTWRCWERKPTDEERKAAEWEK